MWDLLAFYLHFLRTREGLSCAGVGQWTNNARQTVSHWESGLLKPPTHALAILDERYRTGGLLALIHHHAKRGHDPNWFRTALDLEARATEVNIWEVTWMPGWFQTEGYARAVYAAATDPLEKEEIDKLVDIRMRRQEAVSRKPKPLVRAFLDQGVIDQPVGGPVVMRGQLDRLVELAQLPNVVIRVVPRSVGAHAGRDGSFKIIAADRATFAYVEASGGGRLVSDSTEIRTYRARLDHIGDRALSVDESITLIEKAKAGYS
ncbi:Scr1 family TA system antitoxin-like transcriptional regulator [Thermomonospora umbrina]